MTGGSSSASGSHIERGGSSSCAAGAGRVAARETATNRATTSRTTIPYRTEATVAARFLMEAEAPSATYTAVRARNPKTTAAPTPGHSHAGRRPTREATW